MKGRMIYIASFKLSLGNDKNYFCPSPAICSVVMYVYCMLCLLTVSTGLLFTHTAL